MPLKKGGNPQVISDNIRELHQGPPFQRTRRKFGKVKADKQAVAIALEEARHSKGKTDPLSRQHFEI